MGDIEADLRRVLRPLWRRRLSIVLMAIAGALLGLAGSLLTTRYLAEGVLLTPGVGVQEFKRYQAALMSEARLRQYLDEQQNLDPKARAILLQIVRTPKSFSAAIKPEFAFTEQEVRAFGVKLEDAPGVVGLRLAVAQAGDDGDATIRLLREYVRDTIIRVDLEAVLLERCLVNSNRELELRNADLQSEFQLSQLRAKAERLRDIIRTTPGADSIDSRQVVSLEKGAERFLSPTAQLVAVELEIADQGLASVARARERTASSLMRDYYCNARKAMSEGVAGQSLLEGLAEMRDAVFKEADHTQGIVEQTYNGLDLEAKGWKNTYLLYMRFISEPKGSGMPLRSPGVIVSTALGAILAGLFAVLLALLSSWWRHNRMQITADEPD